MTVNIYAPNHGPHLRASTPSGFRKKTVRRIQSFYYEVLNYFTNLFVANIPSHAFRCWFLRHFYKWEIGRDSSIHSRFIIEGTPGPSKVIIGDNTLIGLQAYFAGVGYCADFIIGSNVNIAMQVLLTSGGHDIDPRGNFGVTTKPCIIEDHAVIFARASIIQAIVGRGAVVLPGAVVTKNVEPFTIVGGVPARPIGKREPEQDPVYRLKWKWRFH